MFLSNNYIINDSSFTSTNTSRFLDQMRKFSYEKVYSVTVLIESLVKGIKKTNEKLTSKAQDVVTTISEKSTFKGGLSKSLLATRNEKRKKLYNSNYSLGSIIEILSFGSIIEIRSFGSMIEILSLGSMIEIRSLGSIIEIFCALTLKLRPTNTSNVAKIFMAI